MNTGNEGNKGPHDGSFNGTFTADSVGLKCGGESRSGESGSTKFSVRDLFKQKELGIYQDGFWKNVDISSILIIPLSFS